MASPTQWLNGHEFEQLWMMEDREVECVAVNGVTKSGTRLGD